MGIYLLRIKEIISNRKSHFLLQESIKHCVSVLTHLSHMCLHLLPAVLLTRCLYGGTPPGQSPQTLGPCTPSFFQQPPTSSYRTIIMSPATDPSTKSALALQSGFASLFKTGELCDFTIHCDDSTWQVHKAVLCIHSKFFAKAIKTQFKVGFTVVTQHFFFEPRSLKWKNETDARAVGSFVGGDRAVR
jgi:hypothetical protein